MGASGTNKTMGNFYRLAEGRVGMIGRAINTTINGTTTPWIYSVVEFSSGGSPSWSYLAAYPNPSVTFPTYDIHVNSAGVAEVKQGNAQTFLNLGQADELLPGNIQ
jgi:hypothetical protein